MNAVKIIFVYMSKNYSTSRIRKIQHKRRMDMHAVRWIQNKFRRAKFRMCILRPLKFPLYDTEVLFSSGTTLSFFMAPIKYPSRRFSIKDPSKDLIQIAKYAGDSGQHELRRSIVREITGRDSII